MLSLQETRKRPNVTRHVWPFPSSRVGPGDETMQSVPHKLAKGFQVITCNEVMRYFSRTTKLDYGA